MRPRRKKKIEARTWRTSRPKRGRKLRLSWHTATARRSLGLIAKRVLNLRFASVLATVCLISASAYFVVFGDYFRIKEVRILGNDSLAGTQLEQAARASMGGRLWNLIPADNLFFAKEDMIADNLKRGYPEIETLDIKRSYPDKLSITIKEKQPALVWCRSSCFYVNAEGTAYMNVNEQELKEQKKRFVKIVEQALIPEEVGEGSPEINLSEDEDVGAKQDEAAAEYTVSEPTSEGLADLVLDQQVSDAAFIRFALDINAYMSHNAVLKTLYYKTKGTKTRELIAYTDKNIRIYLDATQSAEKQSRNLGDFLSKGIGAESISGLKYIYLKNVDRIYYR